MGTEARSRPPANTIEYVTYHSKPLEPMCRVFAPIYSLWAQKRSGLRFPSKDAFTPRDYKDVLKRVAVLRVIDGGRDFEFRIAGDVLIQDFGKNFQGMRASDLDEAKSLLDVAQRPVVADGTPRLIECRINVAGCVQPCGEALFLPLGQDGRTVDHILSIGRTLPLQSVVPTPMHARRDR